MAIKRKKSSSNDGKDYYTRNDFRGDTTEESIKAHITLTRIREERKNLKYNKNKPLLTQEEWSQLCEKRKNIN
jgi:hypothetical protein